MSRRRNVFLKVRLTAEESRRITEVAHQWGFRTSAEFVRASLGKQGLFAMLDNLAKAILTYMPPPAAETKAAAISLGRAAYDRYLKAVGMSHHNGSKAAVESLAALDS